MSALPRAGFRVKIFNSLDSTQLFLRIGLADEAAVQHYMAADQRRSQLAPELVAGLGVEQNPNEEASSPPWVTFSVALPQKLAKEGVKGVKANHVQGVYRTYHGTVPEGSIARGTDRVDMITAYLGKYLDMEAAVAAGAVEGWYPVHRRSRLQQLRFMWGKWSRGFDVNCRQPIHHLWHYYGSRVAFMFAWTGFYCKALTALLVPALVCLAIMIGTWTVDYEVDRALTILQLSFSAVIIVWARWAVNTWHQERNYFIKAWGLDGIPRARPQYKGALVPSPVNDRELEVQGSLAGAVVWRYVSLSVTLFFCAAVLFSIYMWFTLFQGRMDLVASLCLSINIKVFELIFRPVAVWCTNKENHMYDRDYANALIWKNFAFESINYYYPFIYLMVFAKYSAAGCPVVEGIGPDCVWALRRQLMGTVFFLVGCYRIGEVIFLYALGRWKLYYEAGGDSPRSFMEEQYHYTEWELRDQVEYMLQLVLSLGYVVLFGSVAPVVVVIIWAVFIMQLRGTAWFLTHACRRSFPVELPGVGAWRSCIELLLVAGVVVSALVLVIHGEAFEMSYLLTKITFTFLFIFVASVVWFALDHEAPQLDGATVLMERRRKYVLSVLKDLTQRGQVPSVKPAVAPAILKGNWGVIPRLDPTHPEWLQVDTEENRARNEPEKPLGAEHRYTADEMFKIVP